MVSSTGSYKVTVTQMPQHVILPISVNLQCFNVWSKHVGTFQYIFSVR